MTDKVVVITGGSRGIGRATALAAAARGFRVVVGYASNQKAADEVVGCLRYPPIGNVDDIQPARLLLEHLADQVISGADAGRPVRHRTGFGLGVSDQLFQICRWHSRMGGKNQRTADQAIDRPEVADGIGGIGRRQRNDDLRAAISQ